MNKERIGLDCRVNLDPQDRHQMHKAASYLRYIDG